MENSNLPPNGGAKAWSQVLGGFLVTFASWGFINAFGAFQTYYKLNILSDVSDSTISWIGSIEVFTVLAFGVIPGRLVDAGYVKSLLWGGTILVTLGTMLTSLCTEFYQFFLAQGILIAIGCSGIYLASLGVVASYFTTKRSLALGISASGSSIGGIIFPIMVNNIVPRLGFAWTCRIIGFTNLIVCALACLLLTPRLEPRKSGPLIDYASLRDIPFILITFAFMFGYMGIYIPIYYIQTYALKVGVSENLALYLVTILNAGSTLGRILPSYFADKTIPLNVLFPCMVISSLLIYCWIAIKSASGLIAFALLNGLFTGTFIALPPACVAYLTPDLTLLGTRVGMSFTVSALGCLAGAPVGGALLARGNGSYLYAQIYSGTCLALCSLFLLGAMIFHRRDVLAAAALKDQLDTESNPDDTINIDEKTCFEKATATSVTVKLD